MSGDLKPIGRIVAPYGVRGGLKVQPLTDFLDRFDPGRSVVLEGSETEVLSCSWHKGQARLQLEAVSSREHAERLRWAELSVRSDDRPDLEAEEWLASDLEGLLAVKPDGRSIGRVDKVIAAPAHDLLQISGALIPFVEAFVKSVDVEGGKIVVDPIEGMLPGEDSVVVPPTPRSSDG